MESCVVLFIPVISGNGGVIGVRQNELLGKSAEIISILEQEKCRPSVWKAAALEYYRIGLTDDFELILERAVELATLSIITRHSVSQECNPLNSVPFEENEDEPLSLQQINVCTTLAGYHVYKVLSSTNIIFSSGSLIGGEKTIDAESSIRSAEDLLKKAEIILKSTTSLRHSIGLSSNSDGISSSTGRGAQLAAAARLMMCTTAPNLTQSLSSGEKTRRSSLTQQNAHSESHEIFLSRLPFAQKQTLSPLVCYGYLYLAQYLVAEDPRKKSIALTRVFNTFRVVLSSQNDCILARLGLAAAHFASKQYLPALRLYASVLHTCPNGPANLRLALGLCHFHLGGYERAAKAFERVLQLKPGDTDGLCAMSSVELVKGIPAAIQTTDAIQQDQLLKDAVHNALNYLDKARKTNPCHPSVILGLANIAFFGEKSKLLDQLLSHKEALGGASKPLVAEWSYQQGRSKHARGNMTGAATDYTMCLKSDPRHLAARFCLAQVSLYLGNPAEAEKQLQVLVRLCSNNVEVYKLLAFTTLLLGESALTASGICSSMSGIGVRQTGLTQSLLGLEHPEQHSITSKKGIESYLANADNYFNVAAQCISTVLQVSPDDKEGLILRIRLEEIQFQRGHCDDLPESKDAYHKLFNIQQHPIHLTEDNDYPIELVNNLAVLYAMKNEHNQALNLFQWCSNKIDYLLTNKQSHYLTTDIRSRLQSQQVTIDFNRALCLESQGNHKEATIAYKKLNTEHPCYSDPWQRRCWMSMEREDLVKAKIYCNQALQQKIQSRDISFLLADIYKRQHRLDKAIKLMKQVVTAGPNDSYSRTVLGSLIHLHARNCIKKTGSFIHSDVTSHLSLAARSYREALRINPTNWYAANGLAVLMAEQNLTTPALEAFITLLDACKTLSSYRIDHTDISHRQILYRSVPMEATAHRNLGLLYTSIALTENNLIIPGQNITKLDAMKTAKALKHYITALSLQPLSLVYHNHLGRLFHDICRYRDSQAILELALSYWPNNVILRHNLARVLEKSVLSEMQLEQYIADPKRVRRWIVECRLSESLYFINLQLIKTHQSLLSSKQSHLMSPLLSSSQSSLIDSEINHDVSDDHNSTLSLDSECHSFIDLPDIQLLPSLNILQNLCEQVGTTLCTGLQNTLPRVEDEYHKRIAEIAILKAKKDAMLQEQQQEKCRIEKECIEDVKRQYRLVEQLQEEAEEFARSFPSRKLLEERGLNKHHRLRGTPIGILGDKEDEYVDDDPMDDNTSLDDTDSLEEDNVLRFKECKKQSITHLTDADNKKKKYKKKLMKHDINNDIIQYEDPIQKETKKRRKKDHDFNQPIHHPLNPSDIQSHVDLESKLNFIPSHNNETFVEDNSHYSNSILS